MKNARFHIETPRLLIREFSLGDAEFILRLVNTPGWLQFIGDRKVNTIASAEHYLLNGPIKSYNNHGFGLYLMCLKDATPIGMCGLLKRDSLPIPDLGFALLPEYFSCGYTFEAATAVLKLAQENFNLQQVAAITSPENERSTALLKRLGFIFEEARLLDGETEQSLVFKISL